MKKRLKFKNEVMDFICDINLCLFIMVLISKGTLLLYPFIICAIISFILMLMFGGLFSR
jgi:hypothetical protein